jgi:hypothetical protein
MGAALTTQNAKSNLELRRRIDYIAKNFIFDSDFTDMTKLGNEKYCNRLVKKVSEIFKKNKDSIDIVLLRKKLYEIKKNKNKNDFETFEEDDGSFATTSTLDKPVAANAIPNPVPRVNANDNNDDNDKLSPRIQIEQSQQRSQSQESIRTGGEKDKEGARRTSRPTSRKRMTTGIHNIKKKCNEIAKFYVLFAHLFSCIVSTINPSFEIDASSSSSDKNNTGSGSLDFCSSRLNLLINGELIENSEGDVTIRPNVCKTNLSESGSALRLVDLPGIKALLKLFKNGGDDYSDDVKYLYKAFTGKKDAPDDINIEHIPLRVFNKDVECRGSSSSSGSSRSESRGGASESYPPYYDDDSYRYSKNREEREIRNLDVDIRSGIYSTGVIGNPTKEKLFSDYIKNIKLMIQKSENNRALLLEILSEMFTYTYDSSGEISGVIINPSLTFKDLQSLVRRTRKIIIKLYTECEEDYNEGLDIFFALIQEKILSKLMMQDDALQDFALRRRLNEYMVPKNLERSIVFNPYQQNAMKSQLIPPHFKKDVYKEFKEILKKEGKPADYFSSFKEGLDAWITDEIDDATSNETILDPYTVAKEYYDVDIATALHEEDEEKSSASASASAPAVVAPAVVAPAVVAPAVVAPAVVAPVIASPPAPFIPPSSPIKQKKK